MSEFERYSTVWNECGINRLADRFKLPGYDGFLPFFISGPVLEAMEKGEEIELDELKLLLGIAFGLDEFDNHPKPWHRPQDRNTLLYLLETLGIGFGFESPEQLFLDSAFYLREKNGNLVSRTVLLNGLGIVPFSSKIRSDLVCDSWAVAAEVNDPKLIEPIPGWVMEATLSELMPAAKENICYYGLCATVLLEKDENEVMAFLEEFVFPNVELQSLKDRIYNLLDTPKEFSIKDLEITE